MLSVLFTGRMDLVQSAKETKLEDIQPLHLLIPTSIVQGNSIVVFLDYNGDIKILKNRYSSEIGKVSAIALTMALSAKVSGGS